MFRKFRKKIRHSLFKRLAVGVSDHQLKKQLMKRVPRVYDREKLKHSFVARERLETILNLIRPVPVGNPIIRLGRDHDGGYMCIDHLDQCDCLVSCGICDDVSFDLCFAERGITVHQYDDSIAEPPEMHANFKFHRWRVSGENCPERNEHSLDSILREDLKGTSHAVVKLDIESSEWAALGQCDPALLKQHVVALYLECHDLSRLLEDDFYQKAVAVFSKLREDYVPISLHPNNCGELMIFGNRVFPDVFELSFIRKDVVEPIGEFVPMPAAPQVNEPIVPDVHTGALLD